jgi:hypothetical protein
MYVHSIYLARLDANDAKSYRALLYLRCQALSSKAGELLRVIDSAGRRLKIEYYGSGNYGACHSSATHFVSAGDQTVSLGQKLEFEFRAASQSLLLFDDACNRA